MQTRNTKICVVVELRECVDGWMLRKKKKKRMEEKRGKMIGGSGSGSSSNG